jgi:Transcription factor WhiB
VINEWMAQAECAKTFYPDLWFSHSPRNQRLAADICKESCPVRRECLIRALNLSRRDTYDGVWAGYQASYLITLRQQHRDSVLERIARLCS